MNRNSIPFALALLVGAVGCGGTTTLDTTDLSMGPDLNVVPFRLHSGIYKVTGPATMITMDQCMVDPNDVANMGANGIAGQVFALVNDGMGNIKLGNALNGKYDPAESGMPPQPAQGASCPGTNNPAQCATEPNAQPFNAPEGQQQSMGTLVRDNDVVPSVMGGCMYHRHSTNQVTVVADNTITSVYTRTDTKHSAGCQTITTDCTTSFTWGLAFMAEFTP